MTSVLITGAAGYIGRHLVKGFEEADHEVWTLDKEPMDRPRHIVADLANRIRGRKFPIVVHLAGCKDAALGEDDPVRMWHDNWLTTYNALGLGHPGSQFVLASSAAVYGNQDDREVSETDPVNPVSNYGRSKVMAERTLSSPVARGVQSCSLRLFNVYGGEGDTSVIAAANAAAASGGVFTVNPAPQGPHWLRDASCVRDFVHIDRVVGAFMAAAELPRRVLDQGPSPTFGRDMAPPRVFNVGSGRAKSIIEVVTEAGAAYTVGDTPRPGDVPYSRADITLAERWLTR